MVNANLMKCALVPVIVCLFLASGNLLAQTGPEEARQAFIELSASEDELYVQQQLHLRVRLYYTNNVIQGHLKDPEHPDVVIEQLGEQKQYRELLDGERYRVVERNYVIFPQQPGQLQLPPIEFQGTARHPRGHHYRISDSATLFPLDIRDIPGSFSGSTWLPARSVEIHEKGLAPGAPVEPGANLTRTLTLTAEGLPATTLPDPKPSYPPALRAYPEPAQRQSSANEEGVLGQLTQTVALVPVPGHSGEITLPEVRIPWWDVEEDRERIAVLPARTLRLAGAVNNTGSPPNDAEEETRPQPGTSQAGSKETEKTGWLWPLLSGVFALAWLTTAAAWWLSARRRAGGDPAPYKGANQEEQSEQSLFARVSNEARTLDPGFFNSFPAWVTQLTGQQATTVEAAINLLGDRTLSEGLRRWQEFLFGRSGTPAPDGVVLKKALGNARKEWKRSRETTGNRQGLPGFYPQGLQP